jgi:hypothetical protein
MKRTYLHTLKELRRFNFNFSFEHFSTFHLYSVVDVFPEKTFTSPHFRFSVKKSFHLCQSHFWPTLAEEHLELKWVFMTLSESRVWMDGWPLLYSSLIWKRMEAIVGAALLTKSTTTKIRLHTCAVRLGCQMVYFRTKILNLGIFWRL